jgi:hypothetical protein
MYDALLPFLAAHRFNLKQQASRLQVKSHWLPFAFLKENILSLKALARPPMQGKKQRRHGA